MRSSNDPRRQVGITPLKARRLARGQTIREVAEATGINKNAIAAWEIGIRCPDAASKRRLAAHFSITVRDLSRPADLAPMLDERVLNRIADSVAARVIAHLGARTAP